MKKAFALLLIVFILFGCGRKWYDQYGLEKAQLTKPESIPYLIQALSSEEVKTRYSSLRYLLKQNSRSIINPVKKVCETDTDLRNRSFALKVLMKVMTQDEKEAYLVKQYKKNSAEKIRQIAARELKNLRGWVDEPPPSVTISKNGEKVEYKLEVPLDYTTSWRKTVQAIAFEGITLSASDKESGIIQGSKSFDENSNYFICPRLSGKGNIYSFNISATVQEKNESTSIVSIHVEGNRKSYRHKHFICIPVGRKHSETKCESTGELELLILNRISKQ